LHALQDRLGALGDQRPFNRFKAVICSFETIRIGQLLYILLVRVGSKCRSEYLEVVRMGLEEFIGEDSLPDLKNKYIGWIRTRSIKKRLEKFNIVKYDMI
jgi:hypothetical protein